MLFNTKKAFSENIEVFQVFSNISLYLIQANFLRNLNLYLFLIIYIFALINREARLCILIAYYADSAKIIVE